LVLSMALSDFLSGVVQVPLLFYPLDTKELHNYATSGVEYFRVSMLVASLLVDVVYSAGLVTMIAVTLRVRREISMRHLDSAMTFTSRGPTCVPRLMRGGLVMSWPLCFLVGMSDGRCEGLPYMIVSLAVLACAFLAVVGASVVVYLKAPDLLREATVQNGMVYMLVAVIHTIPEVFYFDSDSASDSASGVIVQCFARAGGILRLAAYCFATKRRDRGFQHQGSPLLTQVSGQMQMARSTSTMRQISERRDFFPLPSGHSMPRALSDTQLTDATGHSQPLSRAGESMPVSSLQRSPVLGRSSSSTTASATCSRGLGREMAQDLEARDEGGEGFREVGIIDTTRRSIDAMREVAMGFRRAKTKDDSKPSSNGDSGPGAGGSGVDPIVEMFNTLGGDLSKNREKPGPSTEKKFSLNQLEHYQLLGTGSFGSVFRVRDKETGRLYAFKILNAHAHESQGVVHYAFRERTVLQVANSPFIIWLYACLRTPEGDLALVMEYAPNGNVLQRINRSVQPQRHKALSEQLSMVWSSQVLLALDLLHYKGIIHRDLKCDNIVLDKNDNAKLADFGFARPTGSRGCRQAADSFVGTRAYMAPEIGTASYDASVDLYALGVCIFMMLTGGEPGECETLAPVDVDAGMSLFDPPQAFVPQSGENRVPPYSHEELWSYINDPEWTGDFKPAAPQIMRRLCALEPEKRLSAPELRDHNWFDPVIRQIIEKGHSSESLLSNDASIEGHAHDGRFLDIASWSRIMGSRPDGLGAIV